MDHQLTQRDEAGKGYFSDRIRKYVGQHYADLLEENDAESKIRDLSRETTERFQAYDRTGMPSYEALERAWAETLEGITSPLGVLREFVVEHKTALGYLTGQNELDEPDVLRQLLIHNRNLVVEIMNAANEEEEKTARKDLFRKVKDTLQNLSFPQS